MLLFSGAGLEPHRAHVRHAPIYRKGPDTAPSRLHAFGLLACRYLVAWNINPRYFFAPSKNDYMNAQALNRPLEETLVYLVFAPPPAVRRVLLNGRLTTCNAS